MNLIESVLKTPELTSPMKKVGNWLMQFREDVSDISSEVQNTGFYYDNQLTNPFLTMSLHPSTYQQNNEWVGYQEGFDPFFQAKSGKPFKYCKHPIASTLLTEDLAFSITNDFTMFEGGNAIEGLFNTVKPFGALAGPWADGIKNGLKSMKGTNDFGSSAVKTIGGVAGKVADGLTWMKNFSNSALRVQGTKFSYYNGSNFSMNNLEFKFIKFSDYDLDGNFVNVLDYMSKSLFPYCYGVYVSAGDAGLKVPTFGSPSLESSIQKFMDEYCGVQTAPGGFEMQAKSLDAAIFGTLRLNIGGVYALENLIIKSLNFSLSRAQAKDPENEGDTVPLYAEISMTLAPASDVTDKSFSKMLDHTKNGLDPYRTVRKNEYIKYLEKQKTERKTALKRK